MERVREKEKVAVGVKSLEIGYLPYWSVCVHACMRVSANAVEVRVSLSVCECACDWLRAVV